MSNKSFGLNLTEGRISSLLIRFAFPFMIANLVTALYGIIDMIIIGQFTNKNIMNGVATGTHITSLMFSFIVGIGTGGTVIIGRCIGEKNDESSTKAMGSFMVISGAVVLLLTCFIGFMRDWLLGVLMTPPEALDSARRFVTLCAIGVPFNVGFGMLSAVARGMGNSKAPGIVAAISCTVNVLLCYILIGAAGLEEVGAGIATAGAQFLSFVLIGAWLYRKKLPFKFSPRDVKPEKSSSARIFIVGLPIVMQELLISISFIIVARNVNEIGVAAGAAVGVVGRIFSIAVVLPLAMSSAISAITAQSIGAKKPERAMRTLKWGILYAFICALIIFTICRLWASSIVGIFTNDPVVIELASGYLKSFIIDALFVAFLFCMNAYLSGCGKSTISMVSSLIATFCIRVPLSLYFTGLESVAVNDKLRYLGFASPIASSASFVICAAFILWYNKRLIADNTPQLVSQ